MSSGMGIEIQQKRFTDREKLTRTETRTHSRPRFETILVEPTMFDVQCVFCESLRSWNSESNTWQKFTAAGQAFHQCGRCELIGHLKSIHDLCGSNCAVHVAPNHPCVTCFSFNWRTIHHQDTTPRESHSLTQTKTAVNTNGAEMVADRDIHHRSHPTASGDTTHSPENHNNPSLHRRSSFVAITTCFQVYQ